MSTPHLPQPIPISRDAATGRYYDQSVVTGARATDLLTYLCIGGAIGTEIPALYPVLALLFRAQPTLIIVGTVGLALLAVGLAHTIGAGLRRRRAADRRGSTGLLGASVLAWLALGATVFVARLYVSPNSGAGSAGTSFPAPSTGPAATVTGLDSPLTGALVFAALYIGSGLLAISASYHSYNPDARAYRHSERNLAKAADDATAAKARLAGRRGLLTALEEELSRSPDRRVAARQRVAADVLTLRNHARLRIAAGVGNPSVTDGLVHDAPRPTDLPPGGWSA